MVEEHVAADARQYLERADRHLERTRTEDDPRQVLVYLMGAYADASTASALAEVVQGAADVRREASELREGVLDTLKTLLADATITFSPRARPRLEVIPGGRSDNPLADLRRRLMPPGSG